MLSWRCVSGAHLPLFLHKCLHHGVLRIYMLLYIGEYVLFAMFSLLYCSMLQASIVIFHDVPSNAHILTMLSMNENRGSNTLCKKEIVTMDVKMCEEPCTDEDAPMANLLRRSSQKAAHNATHSIRLHAKEGSHRKSSSQDGAYKRPAVGFPQVVEPTMSNPLYVPIPNSKSFRTKDSVMCLGLGEKIAPTTCDDTAWLEGMDRT